jgi:hypothetical protein
MTKFSYEVPLAHLDDFDKYQDLYFILSFLCMNPHYRDFIKEKRGDRRVILDNSFNELGVPDRPDRMAKFFYELNADFVVSPDSDGWSLEQLTKAYKEMTKLIPEEKVLVVVRSVEEWNWFIDNGSPYYCTTFYHRPELPKYILNLSYHFLGLNRPEEIKRFGPISCDTSMPIKLALQGKTMSQWISEGCPHIHTKDVKGFFDLTLTKDQLNLALENCKWIKINLDANLAL